MTEQTPETPMGHIMTTEMYKPTEETEFAQFLYDSGLLFMVNTFLHHYGLSLCVDVDDETGEKITGLGIVQTSDPQGWWFGKEEIIDGRRKLRDAGLLGAGPRV